jgi:putative pyruvate formate lyase activating enzyme
MSFTALAKSMLYLQNELSCHNINFVSPSHFAPQITRAVLEAIPLGLKIPLVYNTNSYDPVKTLKELEGIISIYLPDLRYASATRAEEFSQAPDYVFYAREAIKEMYRQVGELVTDEHGIAQKGLIVRHLILPNELAGSEESLSWLAKEVSPRVTVSIMSQYLPLYRARQIPELERTISASEYSAVLDLLNRLKFNNGWMQEIESPKNYLPDFERNGHPFQ